MKPTNNNGAKGFFNFFANCCGGDFTAKIFVALLGILFVYAIVLLGTMIRNNLTAYAYLGQAPRQQRTISITAEGRVTAAPDVAITTLGLLASGKTVAEAQEKNTAVMNKLIGQLKTLGIEEKDIQTINYNLYPQYNYKQEQARELSGYEVQQSVSVKIRDLSKVSQALALAGEVGANIVSGLSFTVDDREVYRVKARDKALAQAALKARALAEALGVRFVQIVSYEEFEGEVNGSLPLVREATLDSFGGAALQVEVGSMEVVMNVSIGFEIR